MLVPALYHDYLCTSQRTNVLIALRGSHVGIQPADYRNKCQNFQHIKLIMHNYEHKTGSQRASLFPDKSENVTVSVCLRIMVIKEFTEGK